MSNEPRKRAKEYPEWLKKPWPAQYDMRTHRILEDLKLNTVCQSAECPNLGECWSRGAATFMILGENCTRSCNFCAVKTGRGESMEILADEPARVAQATKQLGLKHVVVTSVARDDLKDEGAGHFAQVITLLRSYCGPELVIEVLTPDFHAREDCLATVVAAKPNVFNHNIETTEALHKPVRPQGNYRRTLKVLETVKRLDAAMTTKSGMMVGLGESQDDVKQVIRDLRGAGCDILTIGQYLSPSTTHLPVAERVHPDIFKSYELYALSIGFSAAACGPFVRSSYQAEQVLEERPALARAHAMPTVSEKAVEELRGVYARMDTGLQPFRRHCAARGHCCNFTKTGHMLYVTDLEAAEMARCGLEPVESQAVDGTCPYLRDSKCGAREHRGLGCRIYYCDATYEAERNEVYEAALKEIRAIEAQHGIAHKYRPVTAVNFKEFVS